MPDGDGSAVEIPVDAELWVLAPNTIVDVVTDGMGSTGGSTKTSGPALRVLRNDADRLALRMAGAIARYVISRGRASLTYRGIKPWTYLVGHVLTVADEAGDVQQIQAVVTSVELQGGSDPRTIVHAGYSGGS